MTFHFLKREIIDKQIYLSCNYKEATPETTLRHWQGHVIDTKDLDFVVSLHPYPAKKGVPSCHKYISNEENIIPAPIPDLEDDLKEVIMHLPSYGI